MTTTATATGRSKSYSHLFRAGQKKSRCVSFRSSRWHDDTINSEHILRHFLCLDNFPKKRKPGLFSRLLAHLQTFWQPLPGRIETIPRRKTPPTSSSPSSTSTSKPRHYNPGKKNIEISIRKWINISTIKYKTGIYLSTGLSWNSCAGTLAPIWARIVKRAVWRIKVLLPPEKECISKSSFSKIAL